MDNEEPSCSCSYSSSQSSTSTCSISTGYSRKQNRIHSHKPKFIDDTDQFDASFSNLQTSSFEPIVPQKNSKTKKTPIIIEKIVPKPVLSIPILNPKLPQQSLDLFDSEQESNMNYNPSSDFSSIPYHINERGEKITKEGNRIVFMDVVQMNTNQNPIDLQSYRSATAHSKRQRAAKHIPILDIQSIERLFNETNSKNQQRTSINIDNKSKDPPNHINHSTATDKLEIIDRYLEDYQGNNIKSTEHPVQSESSSIKNQRRKSSIISSTNNSKTETHPRRSHSSLMTSPPINYVERPLVPSSAENPVSTIIKQNSPTAPVLTNEKLHRYISDIYGIPRSIQSASSSGTHQEIKSSNNSNPGYLSAFRYMQSSMNRNAFQEYPNAY
jgi:hypothetical protein